MSYLVDVDNNELKCSVEQLVQLFYSYREKGFELSAFTILSMLCRNASSQTEIRSVARILDEVVFKSNNIDLITSYFTDTIKPILHLKREVPVLMFHLYGWLYGGAERALTGVTNYLVKKYKVIIVVFEPIKNTEFRLDPYISFIAIHGENERIKRLMLLTKLLHPDIFLGNNNSIPELVTVYPLLLEEGIKTIAYNHEYYFFPHNHHELFTSVVERDIALAKANASCFLTCFSANAYSLINSNAAVIPNINTFQQQFEDSFNQDGKTILAVGRFSDAIKRLDRILKSFKLVLVRHPDAKLVVVGPYNLDARIPLNSKETIFELLKELDLNDSNCTFVGEQEDITNFYKNSDVFVMTSENEGFAVVLTEAGSFGLPAVIFSIPGLEDIISDGVNGFIVPQNDIRGMANKLSDILDDVNLRKEMSEKACELSLRFSAELIGARWEKLINIILTHNNQDEIDLILSKEFMNCVSNYSSFAKQIADEYNRLSIKIVNYKEKLSVNHFPIFASVEISAEKLKFNFRNYGFRETLKKIIGKIKKLIRRYYNILRWKLSYK